MTVLGFGLRISEALFGCGPSSLKVFKGERYSSFVSPGLRQVHDKPRLFMLHCVVCCASGVLVSYLVLRFDISDDAVEF